MKGYGASLIGQFHQMNNLVNQDSFVVKNYLDYQIGVVCDGIGSCISADVGSNQLCKTIVKQYKNNSKNFDIEQFIKSLKGKWVKRIRGRKPSNCGTTCLFYINTIDKIYLCQIGDGLLALLDKDKAIINKQKDDEFTNETKSFYRSEVEHWSINVITKTHNDYKVLMCTDGISEDINLDKLNIFINRAANEISKETSKKNNIGLLNILKKWPNKYSIDDKTVVILK